MLPPGPLLVIFIGSAFQIILMVAVAVGNIRRDLVEVAYTLGAGDRGIIARVLLPSPRPGDAGNSSACAGMGVDLRHRRRTDRVIVRHRTHDHRQPGAA
jgi:hypothetical protein